MKWLAERRWTRCTLSFAAMGALLLAPATWAGAQVDVASCPDAQLETEAVLRIRQFNVGQGDAALITTPEGRRILIDAGPKGSRIADLLADEGVDTLDLVIASHNHADHIGGLAEIFRALVVRAYLENGIPHKTAMYGRTMAAVDNEPDMRYLEASSRTITIGSIILRVIPPPMLDRSQNNNSVGILIEFGDFSALFTGDSERAQLSHWLATGQVPRVDVIKAAHHGGRNGTTAEWVEATSPQIVLLSVGSGNGYGHPAAHVEQLWSGIAAQIYRTDIHGTIELSATSCGVVTVRTDLDEDISP